MIDVPNFPERVLRRKRYPRQYIYSFFPREKRAPRSPLLFFITRVSTMHTGCHRRQFARKLQLKNISLWPVDHRPRWESSPGPESFSRLQPSIRACQKLKRVGERGRGLLGDLKRECDRRWQADGFRLRQRRGKRKREIFHGLCSVVVIACYFSGGRPSFIFFVIFKYFLTLD